MNYIIDEHSSEPAYIQLYRFLVKDITEGIYPENTKLPSKRNIASEVGVSVITVEHALALLCEEGYVESRERSGYFVIYKEADFLFAGGKILPSEGFPREELPSSDRIGRKGNDPIPGIIHKEPRKQAISPEAFPYSVLAKTMRRVILDYGEEILIKSPNHGCMELREEICKYLARSRAIHVKPQQVIIGSGAEYLYGLIAQLLGKGSRIAIEDPCYEKIPKVYRSLGIACDALKLSPEGLSSEDLARTKADALHITPFHSYPSGISVGISKKKEYLLWARERDGILIEDNYDSELTVSRKSEDSLFAMAKKEKVLYINTFSKTIAPSMRIGYLLLPETMTELFQEKLGFYSCTVPLFEQFVLAQLLKNGDFERHINRVRRKKRRKTD